jgi:proteasome accessory factor A
MEPLLFGLETEYALGSVDARGAPIDRARVASAIIAQAQETYPHLPDETLRGMFLPNGARFYLDAGHHPEMSTPECDNPWDVVRYTMAGHRIVTSLAHAVDARQRRSRTTIFRSNVDYHSGNTFGSHESYGHRVAPADMAAEIVPHLVSRIVYSGGGGFTTRPSYEFLLSPRAAHIVHEKSPESTRDRGIIHTKDEPLRGGPYHRLHLICGETTCSELSGWLRVGTTALIVALIDAGQHPGAAVQLSKPLHALHRFARDPSCTATAATVCSRPLTAVAIQRHYLAAAEAHLDDGTLPPWAREVCARWRTVLDDLETRSPRLDTTLDWAIKLALYRERARSRDVDWASLARWGGIISRLQLAWHHSPRGSEAFQVEAALAKDSPIADVVAEVTPAAKAAELDWQELPRVFALRDELHEIDLRFGHLDDDGIFNRLDAAGVLAHHVDGIDRIDQAMNEPPSVPRARRRAELVRELSSPVARYSCDWVSVTDHAEHRIMDLSDPFAPVAWMPITAERSPLSDLIRLRRSRQPRL